MNNIEFYVKYLENQPVPIDTAFGRGPQGILPLITVAHLVAAAVTEPTRGLLGLPKEYGSLTLHSSENGELGPALRPGLPLVEVTVGRTDDNPLVICSANDAVGSNPTPHPNPKKLIPNDSAIDLSTIHPDVQATIWKSVVRISCEEFIGSGLIIDKYDEDVKALGDGLDKSLYILTNLHLLGNDEGMMNSISADFQKEVKKAERLGQMHVKKKNKKQKLDSQDPLKVYVQQLRDGKLVTVLDFILENDVCWEARSYSDMMIFKVPIPKDCSLEKCEITQFNCDTMSVHIFGFPGALVGDNTFKHDYAIIPAQITGRDEVGHLLLSTLSTPGLSGSAIVCTGRGWPIGYICGGFDTGENNQQYQCYGYSFTNMPLPRFRNKNEKIP